MTCQAQKLWMLYFSDLDKKYDCRYVQFVSGCSVFYCFLVLYFLQYGGWWCRHHQMNTVHWPYFFSFCVIEKPSLFAFPSWESRAIPILNS